MKRIILTIFTASITAYGQIVSGVFTGTFGAVGTVANPIDSNGGGCSGSSPSWTACSGTVVVTLTDATSGATMCFRTDGIAPTAPTPGTCGAGSTTYSGTFNLTGTTTVKALGTKSGMVNSGVLSSVYTFGSAVTITQVGTNSTFGQPSNIGTDLAITLSPTPTAGHTLVFSAAVYNCTAVTSTVTDNQSGNTYTLRQTPAAVNNACTLFFEAPNINVSGTFIVNLHVTAPDYMIGHVYDVSTAQNPSFDSATGTDSSHTVSTSTGTTSITTVAANTVVWGNFSGIVGTVATAGSGWTLGYSDDTVSSIPVTLDDVYQVANSAGAKTPNLTWALPQGSGYAAAAMATKY